MTQITTNTLTANAIRSFELTTPTEEGLSSALLSNRASSLCYLAQNLNITPSNARTELPKPSIIQTLLKNILVSNNDQKYLVRQFENFEPQPLHQLNNFDLFQKLALVVQNMDSEKSVVAHILPNDVTISPDISSISGSKLLADQLDQPIDPSPQLDEQKTQSSKPIAHQQVQLDQTPKHLQQVKRLSQNLDQRQYPYERKPKQTTKEKKSNFSMLTLYLKSLGKSLARSLISALTPLAN